MHTRRATPDDKAAMLVLGEHAYMEARYGRYPLDRAKFERLFELTQGSSAVFGFVLVDNDVLIGMVIGLVTEHFFAAMTYCANLVLYVAPEKRGGRGAIKLIRAFEAEAVARGANEIMIGSTSNIHPARTMALYHALGYNPIGANAVKYIGE